MLVIFACVVGSFFLSCLSCLVLVGGFFLAWVVAIDGGDHRNPMRILSTQVNGSGSWRGVCFGWICPI
jgi:hypothetical protein